MAGALPEIEQIVLATDRNRPGCVAIVVPAEDFLHGWEARQSPALPAGSTALMQRMHPAGSIEAAASIRLSLQIELLAVLARAGEDADLSQCEIPVGVVVELNRWSQESGPGGEPLLTLTGKPKRGAIRQTYLAAVGQKYGDLEAEKDLAEEGAAIVDGSRLLKPPPDVDPDSEPAWFDAATALHDALQAEAEAECHSQQQHEYVASQRRAGVAEARPRRKRGSRIVDTSLYKTGIEQGLTEDGARSERPFLARVLSALVAAPAPEECVVRSLDAVTARARDWLAPTADADRFCFRRVRDIDTEGALVPGEALPSMPTGPTDMTLSVVIDLPVARLQYLRSMGVDVTVTAVKAFSSEPFRRLRNRICHLPGLQCPARALRIYLKDQTIHDDHTSLSDLGIVDGTELTVLFEQEVVKDPFYMLPHADAELLNQALARLMAVGLSIRENEATWVSEFRAKRRAAELSLADSVTSMHDASTRIFRSYCSTFGRECAAVRCPSWVGSGEQSLQRTVTASAAIAERGGTAATGEPPLCTAMRAVLSTLISGNRAILEATEKLGSVKHCASREAAFVELTSAIQELRQLGDELDVDTRILPITWTLDLDWVCPPAVRETTQCFMPGCGKTVFVDAMSEHTNDYAGPCTDAGVVPPDFDDGRTGTAMGGSLSVICDVSGAEIDPEDSQVWPPSSDKELPFRNPRIHSIESGVSRKPLYHEIIEFLWHSAGVSLEEGVPGAKDALALVRSYDVHHGETWVHDKQNLFWLHQFVLEGKNLGLSDTPSSMFTRSCNAFAERPAVAVPTPALVTDALLPRHSARTVLPDAANAALTEVDGFLWLKYKDLGRIVDAVARGLASDLPAGSLVAISGYNDFEWLVADAAIARAGMCSVGLHTTYNAETAESCVNKLQVAAVCVLSNLVLSASRGDRWAAADLCSRCASLKVVVAMDMRTDALKEALSSEVSRARLSEFAYGSFLDWVSGTDLGGTPSLQATGAPGGTPRLHRGQQPAELPDPFEARGAKFHSGGHCSTILFTSGSSGVPKAVAIGTDAFVADISGDQAEAKAIASSLTVSYIPLSHSSDRYKVWQHVALGGRVAFVYFAVENWSEHETSKKDQMLE